MKRILKTVTICLVFVFAALAFAGMKDYLPREYMAVPFGLVLMCVALDILVHRRTLRTEQGHLAKAGSRLWRTFALVFWSVGLVTAYVGILHAVRSGSARHAIFAAGGFVAIWGAVAILKVKPSQSRGIDSQAIIRNAETYFSYGRTARAIRILESALTEFPAQSDIARKLDELKNATRKSR
jgi:hypothetical protein